jgi:hypothetical protein
MKCFSLGDLGSVLFSGHSRFPVASVVVECFSASGLAMLGQSWTRNDAFFSVRNNLTTLLRANMSDIE